MTERDIHHSIKVGRLVGRETWDDITSAGLSLFPLLSFSVLTGVVLIYDLLNSKPISTGMVLFFAAVSTVFIYGTYKLINENKLVAIETGLNVYFNKSIVIKALKKLEWNIVETGRHKIVAEAKEEFGATTERIVVLIAENYIYVNIKYKSGSKIRFPFLTGFSEKKLIEIREEIEEIRPTYAKPK
jgi:hypothetical protein